MYILANKHMQGTDGSQQQLKAREEKNESGHGGFRQIKRASS